MAREIAISIYLFVFRFLFNLFNKYPQKEKTVCVASFGDNIYFATNELRNVSNQEIIILKDKSCTYPFDTSKTTVIDFNILRPISFIKSIYHLATASNILIDNYFGFLAVTDFKPTTTCIQLWHANGAIKNFGLLDPTNKNRTDKAIKRFKKVYDKFDYTVVGSEKMAGIFRKSFGLTNDRILRTGIPRTDFFFDEEQNLQVYHQFTNKYPILQRKKVILYAPTFRNDRLNHSNIALDIKKLYETLSEEYVLFIKMHPAVRFQLNEVYEDFVYDVSKEQINELLLITDILISDYSSIPFEFALLEKPMIFYAYDMEEYRIESGLMKDYENQMPGPIVFTTDEIIEVIRVNYFDFNKIQTFRNDWNTYSTGKSSLNLAHRIVGIETGTEKVI